MDPSQNPNVFHATTIVSVRRHGRVVVAGDGQVTLGNTVMKSNARKVRRIGRIVVRQRQGCCAAGSDRNRIDVEARQGARCEMHVREQVRLVNPFHGDNGVRRCIRHRRELALSADPDVAVAIGHRRMKQGDIRPDRREQNDRVVLAEGIVDHAPVGPVLGQIRSDQPAQ